MCETYVSITLFLKVINFLVTLGFRIVVSFRLLVNSNFMFQLKQSQLQFSIYRIGCLLLNLTENPNLLSGKRIDIILVIGECEANCQVVSQFIRWDNPNACERPVFLFTLQFLNDVLTIRWYSRTLSTFSSNKTGNSQQMDRTLKLTARARKISGPKHPRFLLMVMQ